VLPRQCNGVALVSIFDFFEIFFGKSFIERCLARKIAACEVAKLV
jgi:hypothetical protein